jgi:TolB protein
LSLALGACGELPPSVRGSPSTGLVFARVVEDSVDLARGRISDGATRALTRTPDRDETWPYWSELSRRLLFQVGAVNGRSPTDLVLWLPNTGEEIALTQTPRRSERWPVWSPTRRQFAFVFYGPFDSGVAVYDLESDPATRLIARSSSREMFLRPSFSPDGRRMVAQRRGPGGRGSDLWLLAEGEPPVPLTSDVEWFDMKAWFTRDGGRIVFSRRPSGGDGWFEIADIGVEAHDLREIAPSEQADVHSARPSPIRDEIAFVSDRDGNFEVYLAAADGSDVRRLTQTSRDEFAPRWSPTGELLVVLVADQDYGVPRLTDLESLRGSRIAVLDRSGELLFETHGFMPDWMPPW